MPTDTPNTPWGPAPTSKTRNSVQRYVNTLLNDLAPERALTRGEQPKTRVEQFRTPNGCILQAENAALSVSWFSANGNDPLLGELQIRVWRGVVTRRGSPKRKEGAIVVRELSLRPMEEPRDDRVWRANDRSEYSNFELAAFCTSIFDQQLAKNE
jgi:hypothetical protein